MQYIPPAPPVKKPRGKTILLTLIATVGILAVIGSFIDDDVSSSPSPVVSDAQDTQLSDETSIAIMRLTWENELTEAERTGICDFYNTPPVGTTPEMVQVFAEGAEIPYDQAERLLNQLLAEEC